MTRSLVTDLLGCSVDVSRVDTKDRPYDFEYTIVAAWLEEGHSWQGYRLMVAAVKDSGIPKCLPFADWQFMPQNWLPPIRKEST